MTHRRDNSFLERKNIALFALVVVSVLALLVTPLRGVLTQGVYTIAPALWNMGDATANVLDSVLVNFKDKNALAQKNNELTALVDRMQAQVLDRNLLAEKVAKLEETLGRAGEDDRVVANVLAGPGRSPYDTLIIDAGADEGVSIGDRVVYAGSGVIGEIVESERASSKVKLYSFPNEEHAVLVGAQAIPATASAHGMGNFEAKVPQNSKVAIGDNVISAKGNLLLGVVSLVEEKPAEPFKRILFRLPFNISEIRSVEVLKIKK